jgi:hypothetical protein
MIGGMVAGVAGAALLVLVLVFVARRRRRQPTHSNQKGVSARSVLNNAMYEAPADDEQGIYHNPMFAQGDQGVEDLFGQSDQGVEDLYQDLEDSDVVLEGAVVQDMYSVPTSKHMPAGMYHALTPPTGADNQQTALSQQPGYRSLNRGNKTLLADRSVKHNPGYVADTDIAEGEYLDVGEAS